MKYKNNIKKYLERRQMSQRELAELSFCTVVSLCRYIDGTREPKISTALMIAKALKADVYDVFPLN